MFAPLFAPLYAQPLWVGLHGRIGGVVQLPTFTALPGFPNAGVEFSPSIHLQGGGGLEVGMVASRSWTFVGGIGVMHTTSTIRANEGTTLSIDGDVVPATIQHAIQLQYTAIDASLSALYTTSSARFRVGVIARAALQPSVSQSQQILDPPGVQFPVSTDSSGPLPGSTAVVPMIELGIESVGAPVGSFMVEPNVRFEIPLASISSSVSWTMVGVSLGIRIRTATSFDEVRLPDTIAAPPPVFIPPIPSPPTYTQRVVRDTTTSMAAYGVAPSVTLATSRSDTVGTVITVREQYVRTIAPPPPVVIVSVRTTVLNTHPVVVRFVPTVESDAAVDSWSIEITLPDATIQTIKGTGALPTQIDHQIQGLSTPIKKRRVVCTYRLFVRTIDGSTTATSPGEIVLTGR